MGLPKNVTGPSFRTPRSWASSFQITEPIRLKPFIKVTQVHESVLMSIEMQSSVSIRLGGSIRERLRKLTFDFRGWGRD